MTRQVRKAAPKAKAPATEKSPAQSASAQPAPERRDATSLLREITQSSALVVTMAIVASLLIGGILIVLASEDVLNASTYFFSRPGDLFAAMWTALSSAYVAMFEGAIFDPGAKTFTAQVSPITDSLTAATPLIFAGLGLGLGFRAGLFNIGAQGQIIIGATLGAYIGFAWDLPPVLHLLVALLGCLLGGALWGLIPGVLKAKTGAHEVITTIMLNYVALYLVGYLLSREAFQRPGTNNPESPRIADTAALPKILGDSFTLHAGFLLAIAAAFGVWWLLERSTLGFQFRAVGANPHAARTAGMHVGGVYVMVMVIAGALAGLAGSAQILAIKPALNSDIAASFGFDAITVALLGRSRPLGIVMAAILFGALRASGPDLQVQAHVPVDIVLVVQSLIVLFIAAPPLVRSMFRLPVPAHEKEALA